MLYDCRNSFASNRKLYFRLIPPKKKEGSSPSFLYLGEMTVIREGPQVLSECKTWRDVCLHNKVV